MRRKLVTNANARFSEDSSTRDLELKRQFSFAAGDNFINSYSIACPIMTHFTRLVTAYLLIYLTDYYFRRWGNYTSGARFVNNKLKRNKSERSALKCGPPDSPPIDLFVIRRYQPDVLVRMDLWFNSILPNAEIERALVTHYFKLDVLAIGIQLLHVRYTLTSVLRSALSVCFQRDVTSVELS